MIGYNLKLEVPNHWSEVLPSKINFIIKLWLKIELFFKIGELVFSLLVGPPQTQKGLKTLF